MGGGTQQVSSSTAPSNPQVTTTLNQLLGGVQNAYAAGPTTTGAGATTQQGWQSALNAANNGNYATGINSALTGTNNLLANGGLTGTQQNAITGSNNIANQYGQLAAQAGQGQNAPGYQAIRNKLSNDVMTGTNAAFNNSGLFGTDNNQTAAALGLTQGLGGLDYSNYQYQQGQQNTDLQNQLAAMNNGASIAQQGTSNTSALAQLLPQIFAGGQLPGQVQQQVGAAQDANTQNLANKNINLLSQLSSILNGNAQTAGSTTTQTSPAPNLLQSILGAGVALL
jgi:hypothetical protein